MMQKPDDIARKFFGMPCDALDAQTQKVARHVAERKHIAGNIRRQPDAEHGYEVNLKAELEIMLLHEKADLLRAGQRGELLASQQERLALLASLIEKTAVNAPAARQAGEPEGGTPRCVR